MLILGPDCILLRVEWQSNCATDEVACSAYVRQMVIVHAMNRWSLYVNLAGINVNMNGICFVMVWRHWRQSNGMVPLPVRVELSPLQWCFLSQMVVVHNNSNNNSDIRQNV